MKKIAFMVGRSSYLGGLEKVTTALSSAFAKRGCHVTLLTTGTSSEKSENIEIHSLAPSSKLSLYQLIHFNSLCQKWLQQHPQDLTFGLERTTRQDLYRAGSGVHKVYLERRRKIESWNKQLSIALNPFHRTLLSYEKQAFEEPSLRILFTNSEMVKNEILTHYNLDSQKLHVVPNGVDFLYYEGPFQKVPSQKSIYQFLFVGNGYLRKGLPLLLHALGELKEKEWHLNIVGKEKNLTYYVAMAHKLGISSKVKFHGAQADLIPFYQQADALIIPSIYDPFANVTLEALAMGLFVISSPFNGGSELLQPSLGCRIENLFDRAAFVEALKKALSAPRENDERKKRREAIREWDLPRQLDRIVTASLDTI